MDVELDGSSIPSPVSDRLAIQNTTSVWLSARLRTGTVRGPTELLRLIADGARAGQVCRRSRRAAAYLVSSRGVSLGGTGVDTEHG